MLHHVAVVNTKTISKEPMKPIQAGSGCIPSRNVDDWLVIAHRAYPGYVSSTVSLCMLSLVLIAQMVRGFVVKGELSITNQE